MQSKDPSVSFNNNAWPFEVWTGSEFSFQSTHAGLSILTESGWRNGEYHFNPSKRLTK